MNILPFIAVVQLVLIIAYIAGADLGDLITRLPQTADVDLVMAVRIGDMTSSACFIVGAVVI